MKSKAKRILQFISLKQLRDFIRNSSVTRRFADAHSLVYFGTIDRDDESRLIKGITASNTYRDSHYLVGTDYGRDMIFLQRHDVIRSATHRKPELYTWNILAIDLAESIHLPHMYIEGRARHGYGFYETFTMKNRELNELPRHFLSSYDPLFGQRFVVRLAAATAQVFPYYISPERAAVVAHHFAAFDYELNNDMLYVYLLSQRPSFAQLEHMLKAGVWLANELDGRQSQTATDQNGQ